MVKELVTVACYRDLPNAGLAKAKLEYEGISCFLADEYLIGIQWDYSYAVGGVKVRVLTEDAEQAARILLEDQSAELRKRE
jgi:hypothetical protein